MPIYQALQLSKAAVVGEACAVDFRQRRNQLIDRAHLMDSLRREQAQVRAALRFQGSFDLAVGLMSSLPPFLFRTVKGQIARFVARLLG